MQQGPIRVLLIEDDEDDYLLTSELLREISDWRYELRWAASFDDGIRYLSTEPPDVCLVDYRMGSRTGLDLIKDAIAGGCRTPLILLTSMEDREIDVAAARAGAADFHEKERLTSRSLERAIRYAISSAQSRIALEQKSALLQHAWNELHEAKSKLQEITDSIPGAVYQLQLAPNGTMQIPFMSRGIESLYGIPAEAAIAEPARLLAVVNEQDLERFHQTTRRSMAKLEPWSCDFRIGNAENEKWIRGHAIPKRVLSESVCWNGLLLDITAQKATEGQLAQAQKMEAFGQLTGGIAHDLNNLLMVIIGNTELVTDHLAESPEQLAAATMVLSAAERGATLNQRLLAFARRQTLEPELLNVNKAVEETRVLLGRVLGEHIVIETVLDRHLSTALVDPAQLETALLNLAINARDAMPTGGKLTIETFVTSFDAESAAAHDVVPGCYVSIAVHDTGCGMPPDVMARVFEPFFTTKEVGKGSGLGLSMVYGFIRQSDGQISIRSEVGRGTTITLFLPCGEEQLGEMGQSPPADIIPAVTGGRETILVVEDEADVRKFVVGQLRGLGYNVIEAPDGPAALEQLDDTQPPDLLFTDVVMPRGMNGRELADAARLRCPGLKVLFTSGYGENIIVHGGHLDADIHLLPKPYRRGELAREIRTALDSA